VEGRQQIQILLNGGGILKPQDDAGPPGLLGSPDVGGVVHRHDQIGVFFKRPTLPDQVLDRFAEVFQNGAGAVDRRQVAPAHVFENGLTPVADLQKIDDVRGCMHGLGFFVHGR